MNSSKKILFLVNGMGLGNSIRCYSLIQRLSKKNIEIIMVTSGSGEWFFKGKKEISKLYINEQVKYGFYKNELSALNTIGNIFKIYEILKENNLKIEKIITESKPDLIIIDSVYVKNKIKKYSIPIVALNNSDFTKDLYFNERKIPLNIKSQFYLIEMLDFYYHRYVPDVVISPTFAGENISPYKNIKRVGPIYRQGLYKKEISNNKKINILFMLSGSEFKTKINFKKINKNFDINIIGNREDKQNIPNINYLGKVMDNRKYLNNADFCILNSGFSALSEIYYLNIPSVIIPINNHAEQWTNAKYLENNNLAIIANNHNFEDKLYSMINNNSDFRKNYSKLNRINDGAKQSLNIILDIL